MNKLTITRTALFGLISFVISIGTVSAQQKTTENKIDSLETRIRERYDKKEVMIPMRDGVKLHTTIYEPKDKSKPHPTLMTRTPYSCAPYGEEFHAALKSSLSRFTDDEYIIVYQDVRGRHRSEGVFEQVRPLNPEVKNRTKKRLTAKEKQLTDEATDTYDTVEWLIHNTNSNQKVGTWGISYPGFYATMSAASAHPALKAVSPQAPVTDWFRGDDRHHNGAFTMLQTSSFLPGIEGTHMNKGFVHQIIKNDAYTDLLKLGTFREIDKLVGDTTETMWTNIKNHPDFDEFWQRRDARTACYNLKPAMLVVGGMYDSEDCFGAWELYKAIKKQSPKTELYLTFGPWWHGAWTVRNFQSFGDIYFGKSTSAYFMDEIQYPFFSYYLNDKGEKPSNRVNVFYGGENEWRVYDEWPSKTMIPTPFYISEGGKVSQQKPTEKSSYSEYVSDMEHPVPYTAEPTFRRTKEYMLDDQRFASTRSDVLTFVTDVLTDTLTIAGPIEVNLKVAIEGTDADFMVKVIDVYPDAFDYPKEVKAVMRRNYPMGNFQQMVRGELFRGRYRTGFSTPSPFKPGEITDVDYTLYDVAHTFLPGHRLMIQIQSSWFPIIDRNPQKFINTYTCGVEDFLMKQNIRIYHQADAASSLSLPILKR